MEKRKSSKSGSGVAQRVVNGSKQESRNAKDKLINDVNSLEAMDFKECYLKDGVLNYSAQVDGVDRGFHIDFVTSSELTDNELHECYNIIKSTSRKDYESSSFGWHPKRKKREMKEDDMRYLLVRSSANRQSESTGQEPIQAFLSFMLTHDSTPSVPVLYIYEIHLQKQLRRVGLGAYLMEIVEGIAEKIGVSKLMLTCFVSNGTAHSFYEKRGYGTDVSSPEDRITRDKTVKPDYLIMSKDVQQQPETTALSKVPNDDWTDSDG